MRSLTLLILLALALAGCRGSEAPPPGAQTPADQPPATLPVTEDQQPAAAPAAAQPVPPAAQPAQTAPPTAAAPGPQVSGPSAAAARPVPAPPPARYREITIPKGTPLALTLETAVASDTSRVEDTVRASLRRAIVIDDVRVVPSGTEVLGSVIDVARSGKVRGRARIALRFTEVRLGDERLDMRTSSVTREARSTRKKDTAKVGGAAAGGALIGALIGGGKGAAIGTSVGGGAGAAAVMATRGEEVRLPAGTAVTVRLTTPVTVRIRVD